MQFQMAGRTPSLTEGIVKPLYGNMNVIFLFLVPFITMRLFAEEKKLHTIELLMTSPITLTEIILGKFISAFLLILVMMALTSVYPISLYVAGHPDLGPIVGSNLGTLLLVSCVLSIGIFFSALTENQIVAGVLTFAAVLFLWLISWAVQLAGPVWGDILTYLSLISHYNNFGSGLLTTTDIFYYLSVIGVGLFLTHRVLDSYRWR
jgi:ABC-2 type transport system permease protein